MVVGTLSGQLMWYVCDSVSRYLFVPEHDELALPTTICRKVRQGMPGTAQGLFTLVAEPKFEERKRGLFVKAQARLRANVAVRHFDFAIWTSHNGGMWGDRRRGMVPSICIGWLAGFVRPPGVA